MAKERVNLEDAVKGDRREALEAVRDYIAHQLEANLCNTCLNSRLRTGDQASLVLRLTKTLEELDEIPDAKPGKVVGVDEIRQRRDRKPVPQDPALGSKQAGRRQGGRRSGGLGGPGA